jgi:uncharacterized protein (DUF1501 family)
MPVSRREFIQNGLGFVALGLSMPTLLMQATEAMAAEVTAGTAPRPDNGKILVVLEMAGGNDGLNTVAPITDPLYAQFRPNIGLKANSVIGIDKNLGLHPNMTALGDLYEKGKVAVVTGVGYPNANRSHFQSMDIWQSGNTEIDARERTGWLARYFDADGHFTGNPLAGVALGNALPLALWSQTSPATVIGNGQDYGFATRGGDRDRQLQLLKSVYDQGAAHGGTVAASAGDFIRNVGNEVYTSADAIKAAFKSYDAKAGQKAAYPANNGLANSLQTVAKLINGGLPTRVYYVTIGGFDTHANQPNQHANLLGAVSSAVSAFYQDLTLQGRQDDVVLMTFSEFGRRSKENGSAGTDHGAANVIFVVGSQIKGGVHGDYPSLSDLDDGDLRFHTDFRSVYATVLDHWLGVPSEKVLGGQFKTLPLI